MKFNELNLSQQLLRAIEECNYQEATEIQEKCIPLILSKKDVLGQSQTGTGKTAAFALPMLNDIQPNDSGWPKVLVLCPTRELCIQVGEEIKKFSKYIQGVRTVCIYGGEPITRQITDMKRGKDIIVGTPGRVMDHINRKTLRFGECSTFILDEADEMLNMGFKEAIDEISGYLPPERQTILFSATMPKAILDITKKIQNNPVEIKLKRKALTVDTIEQRYYECNPNDKKNLLMQCIQIMNPEQAMIFCNTKKMVDELTSELISNSYPAAAIHGDMKQEARSKVMDNFKSKKLSFLIATDVAARGIDIESMDVVFNYDLPQETEYYVHRIGRTGRAGKKGIAVTFVTSRQRSKLKQLERLTSATIAKWTAPTKKEMVKLQLKQLKMQIVGLIEKDINPNIETTLEELVANGTDYKTIAEALAQTLIKESSLKQVSGVVEQNSLKTSSADKTWLSVDIGYNQDVTAANLLGAIAEATGVNGKDVGKIKIDQNKSYIEVPTEFITQIIDGMQNQTVKGNKVVTSTCEFVPEFAERSNRRESSRGRDGARSSDRDSSRRRDSRDSSRPREGSRSRDGGRSSDRTRDSRPSSDRDSSRSRDTSRSSDRDSSRRRDSRPERKTETPSND